MTQIISNSLKFNDKSMNVRTKIQSCINLSHKMNKFHYMHAYNISLTPPPD